MADKNTISTRISLEGAEDIIKAFRAMGKEGEDVANKLEKAFAAIGIGNQVVSNVEKVKAAFRSLGATAATVGESFRGIGESLGNLGGAAATTRNRLLIFTAALTGAAYGFKAFVSGGLDAIGSLSDLSESLNISAEDLQAFNFAAAQIGVDSNDFTKGITSINDALKELREAGSEAIKSGIKPALEDVATAGGKVIRVYRGVQGSAKDAGKATEGLSDKAQALARIFNKMGVSVNKNLTEFETLKVIANYFKNVAKESDKLGLAIDLFGPKLGPKLVRYLNLGADGIEGFKTELRDLGILLSSDEVALGDKAGDQLAKLGEVFSGFRAKLAVALAPGIIAAADAVTNVIKANAATINAFLAEAGQSFSLFVKDIISLASGNDQALAFPWLVDLRDGLVSAYTNANSLIFDVLIPGFQALAGYLEPVAQGINALFGTELTGTGLIIAGVVTQLVGGFGLLAAALGTVGAVTSTILLLLRPLAFALGFLGAAVASVLGIPAAVGVAIVAALAAAAVAIYAYWDDIVAYASAAWETIRSGVITAFDGIAGVVSAAWESVSQRFSAFFTRYIQSWRDLGAAIRNLWNGVISFIVSSLDSVVSKVRSIIDYVASAISKVRQLISSSRESTTSEGGGSGYASGGYIRGAGTSTSDSIPAYLSNGEFVIRASAVRKYGADLFAALNGMRLSPNTLGRFAMGGLVGLPAMPMAALPAMAGGSSSSLTLVLDNQQFSGLTGPADTIQRLERAIKSRRIRSTGRASPYER